VARALLERECVPLSCFGPEGASLEELGDEDLAGAGVYALHYLGPFPAYARLVQRNGERCEWPIYVGKTEFAGRRRGREGDRGQQAPLWNRLRQHARSIADAENLELGDFRCRYLAVDDIWIGLAEQTLITRFRPVWNTVLDGFGNHDPGGRRRTQFRSPWDVVHPGRRWAAQQANHPTPREQFLRQIEAFLAES